MNIFLSLLFLFAFNGHFSNTEKEELLVGTHGNVDPKYVIASLRGFYKTNPYIYHELSYQLYKDQSAATPYSTESGLYIKQGDTQYSQLSSLESLTTKEYTVSIDNEDKTLMISNHISILSTGAMVSIENWIDPNSTLSIRSVSDRWNELSVIMPQGEVEEAIITYDVKTFQPINLILHYRRSIQLTSEEDSPYVQPRLEIKYTKTLFEEHNIDKLKMGTYVYGSGDHWRLASKYNGYEFINNIHEIADQH